MRRILCSGALFLAVIVCIAAQSNAGDLCCAHCRCPKPCQKVCRLVCEEKKVEVVCWGCKCEDFCLPGCSERGCRHDGTVCETCAADHAAGVCSQPKRFLWFDWCPGNATMYSKTKLMKKVVTKKVPTFKFVVEDLCDVCATKCAPAAVEAKPKSP